MVGLFLAILDFEWCLYSHRNKGLSSPHIGHEWTGSEDQVEAINIRLGGATDTVRWLNVCSCIITIACLTFRQKLKMDWFN
jgi:hypothetical protein